MAQWEQNERDNAIDHQSGSENVKPGSQSGFARNVRALLISLIVVAGLLIFGYNYTHPQLSADASHMLNARQASQDSPQYGQPLYDTSNQLGKMKDFSKSTR